MKLAPWAALALLAAAPAVARGAPDTRDTLTLTSPTLERQVTIKDLKAKLPTVTVTIDDPVYHESKTYDGFELASVLKMLEKPGIGAEHADEIVFQAKDGYSPNLAMSKLAGHRAILAYQEHGNPRKWQKVRQGKAWLTPAPFYLIWTEGSQIGEEYPWPYQLVRIELVDFPRKYAKLYPASEPEGSPVRKGFLVFKEQCLRCHSINLQGGDVGPELNTPKNVTEYWAADTLRAFVTDAPSFRARSKMPSFKGVLKDEDIARVLDYLTYMKDHKIAP